LVLADDLGDPVVGARIGGHAPWIGVQPGVATGEKRYSCTKSALRRRDLIHYRQSQRDREYARARDSAVRLS
ncbi:MAG TPA: hypothetical protein VK607_20475, partial [Kofleriaceae bacterium]|nr:hypothetical protein [Kofleriaceae bacterium]